MLLDVHVEQEHELREWATRLVEMPEAERRSLGRAILMLLDQIGSLRADLERCRNEMPPDDRGFTAVEKKAPLERSPDDMPTMNPTDIGLRHRLLGAARRRGRWRATTKR
jgi:hypothetical protein